MEKNINDMNNKEIELMVLNFMRSDKHGINKKDLSEISLRHGLMANDLKNVVNYLLSVNLCTYERAEKGYSSHRGIKPFVYIAAPLNLKDQALNLIKENPHGIRLSTMKTSFDISETLLIQTLDELIESGQITADKSKGVGRPTTILYPAP